MATARRDHGHARRRGRRPAQGQILVLFAMALVGIMAAAGLAFDLGRFYSEKRFLQNAADAGALAVANALIRGESTTDAEAEGRDVLARNLLASPTGTVASVALSPQYEAGHSGDPSYLSSGILISGGDVRVAIRSDVSYTFGRVVGLNSAVVGGRALVKTKGDLLPIAVRHYINAPGPFGGAVAPCDGNINHFQDLVATANTSCLGSTTDASLRSTPNPGSAFNATTPDDDPVNHGPIIALVGQGASPSNAASFRGFVALDIRNFQYQTPPSNVFYNGVTAGTNANTLKAMEAGWVATGYPGPDFPVVVTPPDPNDQVGIIDGNSSGVVVDAINARYDPGAEILAAVYSGTVSSIPDFSYTVPSTATINTNQNRDNTITMSVTKNASFTGVVSTSAFPDWGDPTHPWGTTLTPMTFSPSPLTPDGTVTWATFETTGAPQGVYTVWVQGHSSSPVLLDHFYPVGISIGSVNRDFSTSGGAAVLIPSTGGTGTTAVTVSTPNTNGTYFGDTVSLSVEGGPDAPVPGSLPTGIGSVSVSPSTITLNKGTSQAATVSVNGGTLGPGVYSLTLRVTGTNSAGQPVTRMVPITVAIATASTTNEYVDILGFTTFRITSLDSNAVYGYAISGVYADMNDPALRRGQVARLVPWN
ncbi:MAG TPA: pilus assembly protein TadG-related protein [Candidatus Limnocylindrales bacterium]|nr:pilus assembly protein TadG-related protein [Candidatus Limnocylindrales bacterium]